MLSLVEKWGRRFIVDSATGLWRPDESKMKVDAFRLAVDWAHEGLAVTNRDGNFVYPNREHLRLFGYSKPAELIGKSWQNLYAEAEAEMIERTVFPELFAEGHWTGNYLGGLLGALCCGLNM